MKADQVHKGVNMFTIPIRSTGGPEQKVQCLERLTEEPRGATNDALKFHNSAQIPATCHVTLERALSN